MKRFILLFPFLTLLFACTPNREELRQQALDFLYASMPLPDSVDYSREFWLENIDCALTAREEMPWGKTIPEREWKHFVLPVRVNNENLDSARMVFYRELKPRVEHLSMAEAILEVNHWCHEHVTYKPSDERTSSPLATLRTAHGRCGEESTFTVTALRSVGIPARQVYTPRWAHTDDNHAWVEAWADGEWHFLGACEPEPVLDLGWFNAPASRGMLMHTKVFGQYDGPEEILQQNNCYTEIDVTSNYAPVSRVYVQVLDKDGDSVPDAEVQFKIYNYAEFYTVAERAVSAEGFASIQAGLGDLFVWAYQDLGNRPAKYGFAVCTVKPQPDTIQIVLEHEVGDSFAFDAEIVPPVERNTLPFVSEEQRELNQLRLAQEDSIRNAYVSTFPTDNHWLIAARGNHQVIRDFRENAEDTERAEALLSVISEKDLRDIPANVLNDSYQYTVPRTTSNQEEYNKYLLNPRVANEKLTAYKQFFQQEVAVIPQDAFQQDIKCLIDWTKEQITIDYKSNPQHLRMTPQGVWETRRCDEVSRNIFFVAVARSMGHLAYISPVNGSVWCKNQQAGEWRQVIFENDMNEEVEQTYCDLKLDYQPTALLPDPKYYIHFSLSELKENGQLSLMEYGEEDTYRTLFGQPKPIWPSNFLLVTGTRMASGKVLVHGEMFNTNSEKKNVPLILRQATEGLQVIGNFNSENLYLDASTGETKSLLSTTGRGYYVFAIIAPNNEPTSHALRDIIACKEQIEQWGGKLMLMFRNENERARFRLTDYPELPSNVVFGSDINDTMLTELCQNLHLGNNPRQATLPIFVITDTFNRIVWYRQGYTIGMGEQLLKALDQTK